AAIEEVAVPGALRGPVHLGQVEVDALPARGLGAARIEERERGAEDGRGDRAAVDGDVGLVEVQSALAVHEEWQLARGDPILALALGVHVLQLVVDRGETVVTGPHRVCY